SFFTLSLSPSSTARNPGTIRQDGCPTVTRGAIESAGTKGENRKAWNSAMVTLPSSRKQPLGPQSALGSQSSTRAILSFPEATTFVVLVPAYSTQKPRAIRSGIRRLRIAHLPEMKSPLLRTARMPSREFLSHRRRARTGNRNAAITWSKRQDDDRTGAGVLTACVTRYGWSKYDQRSHTVQKRLRQPAGRTEGRGRVRARPAVTWSPRTPPSRRTWTRGAFGAGVPVATAQ